MLFSSSTLKHTFRDLIVFLFDNKENSKKKAEMKKKVVIGMKQKAKREFLSGKIGMM